MRDPRTQEFVPVGLAFGSRPRLILAHLNREALLTGSPRIEVEASLTAFVKRVLPRRWVVERSFAWLPRNRRLAKDFERLIEVSTAMVILAIIQLLLRRLATA